MTRVRGRMTSVAVALGLALAAPSAASAGDVVKVRDACDPQTFNDAFGPGICVRGSNSGSFVTVPEFFEAFPAGHDGWSFTDAVRIDRGDALKVRFDRGGEGHTFSRVIGAEFGPGCFPPLNEAMGLDGPPVVDCSTAFTLEEAIGPAVPRNSVAGLGRGQHRFICAIHPWMKTKVTVR